MKRIFSRSLVVLMSLLVGACGVSADGSPVAIDLADVPDPLLEPELTTTTTAPASTASQPFTFYLILQNNDGTFVEPVSREVPLSPTATDVMSRLLTLELTQEEIDDGLATRIPEDTTLQDVRFDASQGVLTLDFSPNLLEVTGDFQTSLFAQIVWTAVSLEGVGSVAFRIDGEPIDVRVGDSSLTTDPVDRIDYDNFRPVDPAAATTTTTSTPGPS